MAIRITDTEMTLTTGEEIVATARFSKQPTAMQDTGWAIASEFEIGRRKVNW